MAEPSIRLDVFLWHARFAKTRGMARDIACHGRLRLDGRTIERPSAAVRVGNILTFVVGSTVRVIRIEALPTRRGPPAEARMCYQDLGGASGANVSQQAASD